MINIPHTLAIITIVAVGTFALRAIPFLVFGSRKVVPVWLTYLGKYLPPAIMATLVVYCLRNINLLEANYGIPELTITVLVIFLHSWKKNILLSVAVSTICYMLMVQLL